MTITPKNQTELAGLLGLTKGTVSQQVKRGMPTTTLEAALAWRDQNIDPARKKGQRSDQHHQDDMKDQPAPVPAVSNEDFLSARRREKIAVANRAEFEEAALRGLYLDKAEIERALFNAARGLRDSLANCARRISAEVAGLETPQACEAVIDREHRATLASFAQELAKMALKFEGETDQIDTPD